MILPLFSSFSIEFNVIIDVRVRRRNSFYHRMWLDWKNAVIFAKIFKNWWYTGSHVYEIWHVNFSMLSNVMLAMIHLRLQQIFREVEGQTFGGKNLLLFGDLLQQLSPGLPILGGVQLQRAHHLSFFLSLWYAHRGPEGRYCVCLPLTEAEKEHY